MTSIPTAQAGTALSPEWDRGFDEAFTDLISSDADLVRAEFDALIGAWFAEPPAPPAPPTPSVPRPRQPPAGPGPGACMTVALHATEHEAGPMTSNQRSPP